MSVDLIILVVIGIIVVSVGVGAVWRRSANAESDDANSGMDADPGTDAVLERDSSDQSSHGGHHPAGHSHNPLGSQPQTQPAWPPASTPFPATPSASPSRDMASRDMASRDMAGPGSGVRGSSVVRHNATGGPATTLWNDETIHGFQDRWGTVQLQFVDDPHNAAAAAEALITDVIESLAATVNAQKSTLDAWRSSKGADTEELRMVVRRYRDFLDRVLGA